MTLPLLERKWDRIDLNMVSREERGDYLKSKIKALIDIGLTNKQITEKLKLKNMYAWRTRKQYEK